MSNMPLLSLIFLFAAIFIGFIRKVNVGILAIALAVFIGRIVGMNDTKIIAGFGSSLFIMLVGVTFLFSIVQINGTLDLIAKKAVALAGKRTWLVPVIVYLVGYGVAAAGPGAIPAIAIVSVFAVPLAIVMGASPIMMGAIGVIGTLAGRMTPITPEGILITSLAAKQGMNNVLTPLLINATFTTIVISIAIYVYFKGYKVKGENPIKLSELPKFNTNQIITIIGVAVMIIATTKFQVNVGLASFVVAAILLLLKVADESQCIKAVPWGVLILITGVGVLMNIVITAGGIDLLAKTLAKVMTPKTAGALTGVTAGIMSWFSSALGVVFPTMIPTVGTIVKQVGGNVTGSELITTIGLAASFAGLSPASTGGALILASYVANTNCSKEEQNKLFIELFVISVIAVALVGIFALLGLYRIVG
jgi:di/tricarboxylate transporter